MNTTALTTSLCHSHSSNRRRSKSLETPCPHTDTIGSKWLQVSEGVLGNISSSHHLPPSLEFRTCTDRCEGDLKTINDLP